jgi:hypothetical protein
MTTVPALPSGTAGPPGSCIERKYGAKGGHAPGTVAGVMPFVATVYEVNPVGHQSVVIVIGNTPAQEGGRLTSKVMLQQARFCGCALASLGVARLAMPMVITAIRMRRKWLRLISNLLYEGDVLGR